MSYKFIFIFKSRFLYLKSEEKSDLIELFPDSVRIEKIQT